MSAWLVTGVALLGALAGRAAVPLARVFTTATPAVRSAGPVGPVSGHELASVAFGSGRPDDDLRTGRLGAAALAGTLVFGGLAVARGGDPALPAFLAVATVGLALALADLACLRLPDPLVAASAAAALGLVPVALAGGTPQRLLTALAGAAVSFAAYVLLALLPGSRLGFGDVKLAAALGLPLGWLGWPALGLGLLLPHLLNGVVVLVLLATRRVRRDTPLPFGPAILAGAWLAVLLA
ncbi:prepilin peptidase [Micromonospora chersina]|uniref:Leader peptidase (Prepilin peptidase) / N-methyltransferase n=1 Tax=Micromonospora chersina TaxID=47854 RepID=A0A1C6VID9_9ACTN|nr:A24 family peptidase [Micromonospora chersina]SCL65824.1 leader peptidase (prepilin peptidase) / N-methyltransferase [Micromonospora chersina]